MDVEKRSKPINIPVSSNSKEYTLERNLFDPDDKNYSNLFREKLKERINLSSINYIHCSPPLFSSFILNEFKSSNHNFIKEGEISSS